MILGASEHLGNGAMATLVHAAIGLHHLARRRVRRGLRGGGVGGRR